MKQPYNTTIYNTALYMRLSRDDELQGESGSIQTQRMMLRQYAAEHGLNVIDEYIDDGWSGTNFDRPDFQRMIDDIEDGKINCVVTKDLSRLGRNYILTGQYTEIYFPSKGVRYIAVNDNVDTINGENELAPFLNILNEMHARQTSKKVKAAMRTRFANGAHYGAYAPLGYVKDPDKKGHLLIDPETRWIIEKIFDLAVHGRGAASITRILVEEKVPTPGWLNFQRYGTFANIYAGAPEEKAYAWTIAQVKSILKEETYIGHSVHNKQTNISFKNKKKVRKPKEEWYRVENTHEAIVDKEMWELAQKLRKTPRRHDTLGEANPLTGLLFCADCGAKMTNHRSKGGTKSNPYPSDFYDCSAYTLAHQKRTHACSGHYIRTKAVRELVLETIRTASAFAIANQDEFMKKVRSASQIRQAEVAKDTKRKLNKDRRRIAELDTIIKKLYESFAIGRITDERFDTLLAEYEAEQKALVTSVSDAESHLSSFEEDTDRAEQFLSLAKKYTDFSELTTPMINEFIEKIIVHAPEKIDGDRVQEVEIYLKFIGRFELPEPDLTPEEIKRQEQLRRHRIKSRERYQKIKAGEHAVGQPFQLICKCCGEEFESKRSNTLFCSPKCRTKFYRQEAAENRKRECVCENCGKTFTATRRDVKYCCDDCRTEANRRMQKERNVAKQIKKNEPVLLDAPPIKENGQKQKTA